MSPPAFLFVDGHSVMHAWPELRRDQRSASRRHLAQLELMRRLRTYQDMSGKRVVIVFDGTHSQRNEVREPGGLQIIYAEASTTADAILERLASRYGRTHAVEVVSADGMVRETILACGAGWTSPEMLKSMCEDAEGQVGSILAKNKNR
jgi:predicted RNA-binding protein with PIN domain